MDFLILGNHPFLDFINTRPVIQGQPVELLADGSDLRNLLMRLGLPEAPAIGNTVHADLHQAVVEAREMREDFRALLLRLFEPQRLSPNEAAYELAVTNRWFSGLGAPALRPKEGSLAVAYGGGGYLAPLLKSGLDLLASPQSLNIRKCSNPDCVLWYVDTTKSRTRRWCSMSICGNVHKAREFRKRHREE